MRVDIDLDWQYWYFQYWHQHWYLDGYCHGIDDQLAERLWRSQVQGMSFIAAVLILNLEEADAFITFANLLNKPCQMSFFRVDHELVYSCSRAASPLLLSPPHLLFSSTRCWSTLQPSRFSSRRIFLDSSATSKATAWLLICTWSIGEWSITSSVSVCLHIFEYTEDHSRCQDVWSNMWNLIKSKELQNEWGNCFFWNIFLYILYKN